MSPKRSFLKPMPVLVATFLSSGIVASGGLAVQAAGLVSSKEVESAPHVKELLLQPASQDESTPLGHYSHRSHSSHASHHSHYSGYFAG